MNKPDWAEGLSIRTRNCLLACGVYSKEEALAAYLSRKLLPLKHPRNYGRKSHNELAKWLGQPDIKAVMFQEYLERKRKDKIIEEWQNGKLVSVEYDSFIEALAQSRIMTIERKENVFELREDCDQYFSVRLTGKQLRKLGRELIALSYANSSPPTP